VTFPGGGERFDCANRGQDTRGPNGAMKRIGRRQDACAVELYNFIRYEISSERPARR
jgi:hypothetical protein